MRISSPAYCRILVVIYDARALVVEKVSGWMLRKQDNDTEVLLLLDGLANSLVKGRNNEILWHPLRGFSFRDFWGPDKELSWCQREVGK